MAKIYKFQKVIDQYTTHCLFEPDYNLREGEDRITELCTLAGWTYVSVPNTIDLPVQPEIIAASLAEVDLGEEPETKTLILASSPVCQSIRGRVVDRIRDRYSINDEIKMIRTGPTPETEAYNDWVEECRSWGRTEKEKLGL